MNDPRPAPPTPPAAATRGSLALGVACAWAILIGGYVVAFAIATAFADANSGAIYALAMLLPWIAMIGAIVWFATRGQPRTAAGVAIGIASIFAVALLLVAACFGLLSTNFH